MKQLLYILLLLPAMAMAQSTDQNYVKGTVYKVPTLNGITATDGSGAVTDAKKAISVTYFDGLGRPMQQVAHRQSGTGTDIVTPIVYDDFGRQTHDYLPIPMGTSTMQYTENDLLLNTSNAYYATYFPDDLGSLFSEKILEASPLGRVLEQGAPGEDWLVDHESDADHTIKFDYKTNTANQVRMLKANATWNGNATSPVYNIAIVNSGYYPINMLYRTITKDENWVAGSSNHTTEEFQNKQGQVVLKRTYNAGQMHDTYYVYDQFGNLTYVLPPLANGSTASAVLTGLCYQYKYDSRNRLVEKKLPGKQWEFIVYDKLDRVVATGPAYSPFSDITVPGWLITKYDAFNRPILTAWKQATVSTSTRNTLQGIYNGATATTISEKRTTSATVNTTMNGIAFNYTNVAEPTAGYHLLTVNYYDDYDFTSTTAWVPAVLPTTALGQDVHYNKTVKPKGLATGSWVRVLETSTSYKDERSYLLYDKKARPILSFKRNHFVGYDVTYTKYDFEGKVLQAQTVHRRLSGSPPLTVSDFYTYTDQGRLLEHRHKINSMPEELIAKNEYDALGQLKNKKVGGPAITPSGLQNVDYTYNIRGWLKGINNTDGLIESGFPTDLFAFRIGYNDVEGISTPLYNGNIGETYWKTHPENVLRKYSYEYDDLNRLTDAYYQKPGLAPSQTYAYDEYLSYDKNGNILSMDRNGYLDSNVAPYLIDKLNYSYGLNSNRLEYVVDQSNSLDGFRDGQNADPARPDYSYDLNGNMTQDWNKGISEITYNHLNLPTRIIFNYDVNKKIDYLYNALGVKLKKVVDDKTVTPNVYQETHYLDGFQYVGDFLQFFPTAEGYVSVKESNYNYVYNYTDHLGNIRLSYTREGSVTKVLEENHYYPFGMKHSYNADIREWGLDRDTGEVYAIVEEVDRSNYQYKYNGMEYQDELSLNWYDYGARNYDPAIGRWMNIDPLAEVSRRWSPYTYAYNNPVKFIDPDGMKAENVVENKEEEKTDYDSMTRRYEEGIKITDEINTNFKKYLDTVNNDNSNIDGEQEGKKRTLASLGIKGGETTEEMIGIILANMKVGEYLDGSAIKFLNSKASIAIDYIERISSNTFKIERTNLGAMSGQVDSDAKITILPNIKLTGELKSGKTATIEGFKITTSGLPLANIEGKKLNNFVINGNQGNVVVNKKFISWPLNKK